MPVLGQAAIPHFPVAEKCIRTLTPEYARTRLIPPKPVDVIGWSQYTAGSAGCPVRHCHLALCSKWSQGFEDRQAGAGGVGGEFAQQRQRFLPAGGKRRQKGVVGRGRFREAVLDGESTA